MESNFSMQDKRHMPNLWWPLALTVAILSLALGGLACGGDDGGDGGAGGGGGGGGEQGPPTPKAAYLPQVFGSCPEFPVRDPRRAGSPVGATVTFQTERGDRSVMMWMGEAAKTLDGPLIFYWHGYGDTPNYNGMSWESLYEVLDMGGIVVSPAVDPVGGAQWQGEWSDAEFATVDQVVACAIDTIGIDKRRIHAMGFSAGGAQVYRMMHLRSGYLASAILYTPAGARAPIGSRQETENKIPSIITWGAADPQFKPAAEYYFGELTESYGFFSILCNHPGAHQTDAQVRDNAALNFFLAHPFGTDPSPYAEGFPSFMPTYCKLTK